MLRILSLRNIQEVKCMKKINRFKEEINKKFEILENQQLYIQLPSDQILMFFFTIFGEYKEIQQKGKFRKLSQNSKQKIRKMFNQKVSYKSKEGQFINQIRLNYQRIHINQETLKQQKHIFNQLSIKNFTNSLQNVYFGYLFQYSRLKEFYGALQVERQKQTKKNVVVIPFKNQNSVILVIFETKTAFYTSQVNSILINISQEEEQIKVKKQRYSQRQLMGRKDVNQSSQFNNVEEGNQNKNIQISFEEISQYPFYKDITWIFFAIMILVLMILTINTFNPNIFRQVFNEQIYSFGQQKRNIILKLNTVTFQSPLQQNLWKLFNNKRSQNFKEYFTYPLFNETSQFSETNPIIKELVINFTQGSMPPK